MKRKYNTSSNNMKPGLLNRLTAKIKDSTPAPCIHEDYQIKKILDFKFCVCNICGHQWKLNK